jgi:hypothetical protein
MVIVGGILPAAERRHNRLRAGLDSGEETHGVAAIFSGLAEVRSTASREKKKSGKC